MHSLQFTADSSSNGMVERDFTVGDVPGVLWSPASGADRAPLVLMGHGGGTHKKHLAMAGRAQRLVTGGGFHVAVIDAPGHGDRPRTAHDEQEIAELYRARAAGEPEGPIIVRYNARLAELAVPEWQATLDALRELPEIGADGPVGHVGIGLGTAIGVPLVAIEPRITAAVFGPHWPDVLAEKAKQITIPVEFDLQWDDERIPREAGLALFEHFQNGDTSSSDVPPDNLAVWSKAIDQSGRQIYLTASGWPVPLSEADALKPYANGVRIDTDVECYCDTVSSWDSSVKVRFQELPDWISHVGPDYWPDLDSMPINNNTGTGIQDGINDTERQTVMNYWAMASAPLYVGGDVQNMDSKAISILSNPEVIAVDQAGVIPREVTSGNQQVWTKKLADGSTVVGVYNTDSSAADVTVNFSDLGLSGSAAVRDLAARTDLGTATDSWTANAVPAHGSRLIKLSGATGGTTPPTTTPPTTTPPTTTPPADGSAIKGVQSGKCVDVNGSNTADGATVTLYTCNGQPNQSWASGNGTLRSQGKCLDVTGGGTADNTSVELWSCNGGGNQQWTLPGDGTIRNPASGRCLDAAGAGAGDGTRLIIWDCNGQPNQQWTHGS